MTRNNEDFQNQALYHGTAHPFQVGDIIEPRFTSKGYSSGVAYASPQQHVAKIFARPEPNRPQSGGRIYQVEPVESTEPRQNYELKPLPVKGIPGATEVLSGTGYRVTGALPGHWSPDGQSWHKTDFEKCRSAACKAAK